MTKKDNIAARLASMLGSVRPSSDQDSEFVVRRNVVLKGSGALLTCPHCGYTVARASGEKACPHCRRGTYGNRFKVKKR